MIALESIQFAVLRGRDKGGEGQAALEDSLVIPPLLTVFTTTEDPQIQTKGQHSFSLVCSSQLTPLRAVATLLHWLCVRPCQRRMVREMRGVFSGDSKKLKMALAALLDHAVRESAGKEGPRIHTALAVNESSLFGTLTGLYPSLVECLEVDAAYDEANLRVPTKMTQAVGDLLLRISSQQSDLALMARRLRTSSAGDPFHRPKDILQTLDVFLRATRVYISWNDKGRRQLYFEALKEVEGNLLKVQDFLENSEGNEEDQAGKEPPESIAGFALHLLWGLFAPCMLSEHTEFSVKKLKKVVPGILASVTDQEFNSDLRKLTAVALVLGQAKKKSFAEVVTSTDVHDELAALAARTMQAAAKKESSSALPFVFFRKISIGTTPENAQDVVQPLLSMLNEKDEISDTVAGFLAEIITLDSEETIRDLLTNLAGNDQTRKRNALVVLRQVFEVNKNFQEEKGEAFGRRLAEALLPQLSDLDLELRKFSATLFEHIEASFITPELCRMVYAQAYTTRSAAEEALLAVLSNHRRPLEAFLAFIDLLRGFPGTVMKKNSAAMSAPNQFPQQQQQPEEPEREYDEDRLFRIMRKWAGRVNQEQLGVVAHTLLRKILAAPSDATLVRSLTTIMPSVADNAVLSTMFEKVDAEMRNQTCLSEKLIKTGSKGDYALVQDLLFIRLAPLLVLKIMPLAAFEGLPFSEKLAVQNYWEEGNGDEKAAGAADELKKEDPASERSLLGDSCLVEVFKRIEQAYEFEQVRKLSAEVLGKFPTEVMVPLVVSKVQALLMDRDVLHLKTYIYSLCHSLANHQRRLAPYVTSILGVLFDILSWYPSEEKEFQPLQSIQLGCIECLSILVCLSFSNTLPLPADQSLGEVVDCVLEYLALPPGPYAHLLHVDQTEAIRICMANTLTTTLVSLLPPPPPRPALTQPPFFQKSASRICVLGASKMW